MNSIFKGMKGLFLSVLMMGIIVSPALVSATCVETAVCVEEVLLDALQEGELDSTSLDAIATMLGSGKATREYRILEGDCPEESSVCDELNMATLHSDMQDL